MEEYSFIDHAVIIFLTGAFLLILTMGVFRNLFNRHEKTRLLTWQEAKDALFKPAFSYTVFVLMVFMIATDFFTENYALSVGILFLWLLMEELITRDKSDDL